MTSSIWVPGYLNNPNLRYYNLLTVLDVLFSFFIVCPCVVGYWRGAWILMDIYTEKLTPLQSGLVSFSIGVVGNGVFTVSQKFLENNLHPDNNKIFFYIASRVYTICFAFVSMNGFRGPWSILDINECDMVGVSVIVTAIVALILLKAIRNVTTPPLVMNYDGVEEYFQVLTMFRTSVSET